MNRSAIATPRPIGPVAGPEGNPMELRADRERCIGSGMCALIAPAVFDQDDADGRVLLLDPAPPAPHHPATREAAHSCPAAAITLSNDYHEQETR
ncbi:ferredoxin [Nocardia sp. NPDC019395]|uniref:ferredoxin n=1 Tax=Nocardia sp. NPDC019395 TaxID=3154686 RepID=UPI0034106888